MKLEPILLLHRGWPNRDWTDSLEQADCHIHLVELITPRYKDFHDNTDLHARKPGGG